MIFGKERGNGICVELTENTAKINSADGADEPVEVKIDDILDIFFLGDNDSMNFLNFIWYRLREECIPAGKLFEQAYKYAKDDKFIRTLMSENYDKIIRTISNEYHKKNPIKIRLTIPYTLKSIVKEKETQTEEDKKRYKEYEHFTSLDAETRAHRAGSYPVEYLSITFDTKNNTVTDVKFEFEWKN